MQIKLAQSDFDTMVDWAKEHLPEESCGLLGGTKDGDVRTVKKVYYLTNIDHTNEHFSMDPKEQLKAIKDMRVNGLTPLGNWHSHPETPARPSQEDIRLAYDSTASYLILSLMDAEHPVLHVFTIVDGTPTKDEIVYEA
ncbi:M67 family metallopeptidase [Eubacterium ramulus]|jgi:proteasome lid subunit RPN8/RPN11|uniref:M67 family metallopeptidase n=1 Tax=Eubacterium ramulus TaxID=39490 RepID=UPI0022E57E93|nr:M67 family metallopeptidase [Eubacterium ramulus]